MNEKPIGKPMAWVCLATAVTLFFVSISAPRLHAQATKASLRGTVTDSSGAVVPGAEITITEVNTNISRSGSTNESGIYVFETLNPGTYRVEAKLSGFKTAVVDRVDVLVNTTQRADLQLQPGAVSETIEVTAGAPLLQTDRSDVGRKIEAAQMEELPIAGRNRNFQILVNLVPGTTPVTREHSEFFNAQDALATRVNGQGRYTNNVQIEGVDNNQRTGLLAVLIPPIEALQTVDVTTSNYDAELGRSGGAVTNVVLKSGTNQFRGSAYEFNRVNALYARNFFSSTPAPHTVFNQFGVTYGGPIIRDKMFFFADYMGIRSRVGNFNQFTVPTMAFRSGDLSAAPSKIYDPATGTPDGKGRVAFVDNRIPATRISPIAKNILALIPAPTNPTALTSNWQGPTVLTKDTNAFDVKVDYKLNAVDNLSVRYDFSRPRVFDPGAYGNLAGGPRSGGFAGEGIQKAQSTGISYTHIFSPRFITDFRFGLMRYRNDAKNQDSGTKASDEIGIKGVNLDWFTSGLTGINVNGFSNPIVGFSPSLPWIRAETNFDYVSNWTLIRGNHTLKWGADLRRNRDDLLQTQTYSPRGLWTFSEGPTAQNGDTKTSLGNSFAAFLLDLPNSYGRDLPGIFPTFRQWQLFTYFQDKWQFGPKLTLDLGVRHEIYFAPTTAQRAGFSNYDPDTNSLILSGVGGHPDNLDIPTPLGNFAPRVGLAYRFMEKTVLRGAFGLAWDPAYPDDKWAYNYPVKQNNAFNAANTYSAAGSMAAGFPAPLPVTIPDSGVIPNAPAQNYISLPPDLKQGYLETWNVAIQRQFPYNLAFEAAYVGNHTVGTLNNVNINAGQIPGAGAAGQPLNIKYGLRTSITRWSRFSQSYHGLQVKFDRRYMNGLALTTAYTFSKGLNYADDNGGLGIPINFKMNYGRMGQDRTHMWVQSFIYDMPFGPGKRWLASGWTGRLLGGWQLSGAFYAYSGTPMTFSYSSTSLNAPGNSQRANANGEPAILGGIGPGQKWFDTSVFSIPAPATFGNAGRNTFSGPGFWSLDMSVVKRFVMTERLRAEIRLEAFNVTNTPRFGNPSSALDSTAFGTITSASGERQVQLAAKIHF